ncbi:MAG: hypothetical protein EOP54_09600 [Sphingobacteriales bacterium]|nr:MAG: hypothetical protein EOP54_09600 [Sphingobacteriales bacterium]
MIYAIITVLFVLLGSIYLYRRSKNKPGLPEVFTKKTEGKLTIDEEFNINRSRKEAELDELLDKINRKGYNSLSAKEKEQLKELSR